MPLDPQCQALIDMVNSGGGTPFDQSDHKLAREAYRNTIAFYTHSTPELGNVEDTAFAGPQSSIAIRIYRPLNTEDTALPPPAIVFYHGGGWAVGDLDTHDHVCRYLCGNADAVIISVDYRLAPEHPFPAPFEDALAAVHWVFANTDALNIDKQRIAVAGDSAGGNLAAAVALALRDDEAIDLSYQLLIYPACDVTASYPSQRENGEGYLLTMDAMKQFTDWYLPDEALHLDYRASPQLAATHQGLPPAFVITAEFDPLRDEGKQYAATLVAAGVAVESRCYDGMIHGFLRMGGKIDCALRALDDSVAHLRRAFWR